MLSKYQQVADFNLFSVMYGMYDMGGSHLIFEKNRKQSTKPGQGTGKKGLRRKKLGFPMLPLTINQQESVAFLKKFRA